MNVWWRSLRSISYVTQALQRKKTVSTKISYNTTLKIASYVPKIFHFFEQTDLNIHLTDGKAKLH